jgi:DUF4097 and DUF4098 domain-containing protein YvlB
MTDVRFAQVRRSVVALAASVALVAVAGCDLMMTDFSSRATEEWTRSYPLTEGGTVEVRNVNGRIEVQPSETGRLEVRAEKIGKGATEEAAKQALARIEIAEQASDSQVRLETKTSGSGFNLGGVEVRYSLRVPPGANVRVSTTNGGVDLREVGGEVTAETTNGSISGRDLKGRVSASTTNGGIDLDVDGVAQGGIELSTTNGGVTLTLPRSASASISARLANGRIETSDLPIEVRGETNRRRLDGSLNGGGEHVRIQTTNGSITIKGKA